MVTRNPIALAVLAKPKTCICAECVEHPGDDLGRIYCTAHTTNPDGVCDDCRVYWSEAELKEAKEELA